MSQPGGGPFAGGQDPLRQGFALQQQGRLAEAEAIYARVLALQPRHAQALQLLGVLKLQAGQAAQGVELLQQAVAAQPSVAQLHGSLAKGLEALGRREDAVASYGKLLTLMPGQPDALYNRGRLLEALGRLDAALADYDRALALKPAAGPALDRGAVLMKLDRHADALAAFDRVIALNDAHPLAHYNRGLALEALDRKDEALAAYDNALARNPALKPLYLHRGTLLAQTGRSDDALAGYDAALARWPTTANPEPPDAVLEQIYLDRAALLNTLGRDDEALACYGAALARWPASVMTRNNRSNLLRAQDRPQDALADLDHAVAMAPDQALLHNNRGLALHSLGRLDDAIAAFDTALALPPASAEIAFNKSHTLLLAGRWEEGWRRHEERKRLAQPFGVKPYPQREWRGEDIAGKTIFLHWEQGLGDTLQFCRYAPLLKARGARVVLSVQDKLLRLIRPAMLGIDVIGQDAVPDGFDTHAALLSLPFILGDTGESFPAVTPYLAAEPDRVAHWAQRIGGGGLRVGINWQGSPSATLDMGRSFPVTAFADIAALEGVRLISLQKGDGTEQLADLPPGMVVETLGPDFDEGPDAFIDTAAAMQTLDLIITSDTSVAHLAGALGRPTWLALKVVPDWRWLLQGDNPWYPGMTLLRQPSRGDWGSVFGAMAQRLAALPRGRGQS